MRIALIHNHCPRLYIPLLAERRQARDLRFVQLGKHRIGWLRVDQAYAPEKRPAVDRAGAG